MEDWFVSVSMRNGMVVLGIHAGASMGHVQDILLSRQAATDLQIQLKDLLEFVEGEDAQHVRSSS